MRDSRPLPESLIEAYQRFRLELRNFFRLNTREQQAVDDLMQTLFLQLLKERPGAEVRDPRQYLFRAAWNVLHNANKRARRERDRVAAWENVEFETQGNRSSILWVE